jgi:hypothetical protein
MIKIEAQTDASGARSFLLDLGERVTDRRKLNEVLGGRLVEELQGHFRTKNKKPNKLGGNRTNFWSNAAEHVGIASATEDGVVVAVGGDSGPQVRIHVLGGTIKPKQAKALTIPIIREAHGLRAQDYEQKHGDLFTIPRRPFLFEKKDDGGGTESLVSKTVGRKRSDGIPWSPGTIIGTPGVRTRSTVIPLAARHQVRPVYFLADKVEIPRDPNALPSDAILLAALKEEVEDWFKSDAQILK